jgi:pimeloyl-ACP methyl ester carboxylesterase
MRTTHCRRKFRSDAPTVLALHGITANALAWAAVVEAIAGRVTVLAPDLRGRAHSRQVSGGWGIGRDAADTLAVIDHARLDRVVVAGHSMGGFVACTLAVRAPERVERVVAVDGGLGFPLPAETDPDRVLDAVVGPAVAKLSMTFDSVEAYLDFHRAYPALRDQFTPQLTAYIRRDVHRRPDGQVVSSCVEAAIRADGREVLLDATVRDAIRHLECPATLLYAARGLRDEPQALYDEVRLTAAALDPARVSTRLVGGTNHYTIVGPGPGADAVAAAVLG